MASFSDFLATFAPNTGKRGRQFEHFVKWFLKNDPEWATQVDEVWLWNDYPRQWGRDCGIDLVFKDKIGGTWAVQAKCYSPNYEITKSDVDKFLSESNRKEINHRLLIATTDRIGANARQVLDGQEKSVVRYHLTHFENAAVDYPDSIERLTVAKRKPPPEPRPHQIEAVGNVVSCFQTADRGQLVMACGTGKTFVYLWVKERLKARKTLVLVPSLGLLSQTLNEWTSAARDKFDALCVCSDQTVNRREEDEAISLVSDLPFPVSSDAMEIAHFLMRDKYQVVFSTYQSSPLIAQAQENIEVPDFDLVIADEAHRCAGKSDSPFGTVLDDRLIKSKRRLFGTATPRVYKTGLKKAAEEFGVKVVDMNDENSFGKRFHTLTFGEAIERDLLTDYRVLIVGVDNERVKEWIENRHLVSIDTGLATDARSIAAQIGLLKAIKDWNLQRLISFHGRVKRAREFSEDIVQVGEWLDANHKPSLNLWADYVSGEMPTIARRQKLKRLKNVRGGEVGLLSNARCLSEGVDVPALDGVAFIDPRSSEIDIIQSVGRAIRLSKNKAMGTIVIPVFIEQTDDAEAALEASDFKPIWDVLQALKSHDDRLSDELDQLRIELGAKRKRSVGASDLTKICFDLPTLVNEEFAESLRTYLVGQTTELWMFWYGLLVAFVKKYKHCRVARQYRSPDGYRLGHWVNGQRHRARLSPERKARLDKLKFDWDPFTTLWEEGFGHLQAFVKKYKHCRVAKQYKSPDGYGLGQWVNGQRATKDRLLPERIAQLDKLKFDWNALATQWEEGFGHLQAFVKKYKHCRVAKQYKSPDGYGLGSWVSIQRVDRDQLSRERMARLEKLGFDWKPRASKWEEGLEHLQAFVKKYKHCRVGYQYQSLDGYPLGRWTTKQRANKDQLLSERKARLEKLKFDWDPTVAQWEKGYEHLQTFLKKYKHCQVPQGYKSGDGYPLGNWVGNERANKSRLSPERKARLDKLKFDWDPFTTLWEEGFGHLQAFVKKYKHCRVSISYKSRDGYRLGSWIGRQRSNRGEIAPERIAQLDKLKFDWDPIATQWEEGFEHLQAFVKKYKCSRVGYQYHSPDGYPLGRWAAHQRAIHSTNSPERRRRLNKLGFV